MQGQDLRWRLLRRWQEFRMAVIVWAIGKVHEIKPDCNYAIVLTKRPAPGELAALERVISRRSKDFGKGWLIGGPNIEIKDIDACMDSLRGEKE